MRVGDMIRRPGLTFESRRDFASLDDPLFQGQFWQRELRRGLFVHASDVIEDADFTALSSQQEGLSCIFFIDGDVTVDIGDRSFRFVGDGVLREGLLLPSSRKESFRRRSKGSQRIRHVVITATPEWLDRDGLASLDNRRTVSRALRDHLAPLSWRTNQRVGALVERILRLGTSTSALDQLRLEGTAVEIVAEAIAAGTATDASVSDRNALSPQDRARLRRIRDFIQADTNHRPGISDIAREAGMSPSSLQRLFRATYGMSVLETIRKVQLERARDALAGGCTIQEAAFLAGYSSPANFATAFRRAFGVVPSRLPESGARG